MEGIFGGVFFFFVQKFEVSWIDRPPFFNGTIYDKYFSAYSRVYMVIEYKRNNEWNNEWKKDGKGLPID